ncbi:MAG: hypothetical protein NVSMB10_15200 [Steroidobacteraceae bacterium]
MVDRLDTQADTVRDRLIRLVREILGSASLLPDPFPVATQLSDLGISSLKMVNLMLALEVRFDIAIPPSEITPDNFSSVATIEALVKRMLPLG